jgi:hypothetical protein
LALRDDGESVETAASVYATKARRDVRNKRSAVERRVVEYRRREGQGGNARICTVSSRDIGDSEMYRWIFDLPHMHEVHPREDLYLPTCARSDGSLLSSRSSVVAAM